MNLFRLSVTGTALAAALLCNLTREAQAIPQSFGSVVSGPFFIEEGVPAEEYFSDEESAWSANSDLPGEWKEVKGEENAESLEEPGTVFGLKATSMVAHRSDGGVLKYVVVKFMPKDCGLSGRDLRATLQTNVAAFTGAEPKRGKRSITYSGKKLVVNLAAGKNGELVARLSRP